MRMAVDMRKAVQINETRKPVNAENSPETPHEGARNRSYDQSSRGRPKFAP